MNADLQSAKDDLAFLKGIVGNDENSGAYAFGQTYCVSGLIYGGQMVLHAVQFFGFIPSNPLFALLIGLGPTALFIPWIIIVNIRASRTRPPGVVNRAVLGVFGTIGLANILLAVIVGSVAWREQSLHTWLIFPCCVFVLQGVCWLFALIMRRRNWFGLVAIGWFLCGIAMALSVMSIGYYILFAGLGMWLCMALPGWAMMRGARPDAR